MTPILADGIDAPMVLAAGVIILVPLMAFEVFVEALVLKRAWRLPYGQLCTFTFFANVLSLLAGIPTIALNTFLYGRLLPNDIPGFFARYPFVAAIGSLTYFLVTLLVEGAYALYWRRRKQRAFSSRQLWRGIVLANVATYAVLAPLHYWATRPPNQIREFTKNTQWTTHPGSTVLFIGAKDEFLKSIRLDGSGLKTIVPVPMMDYLISTDLSTCLFRATNGSLYFYRRGSENPNLIWKAHERFFMNQVAFSPSGDYVAFASEKENSVAVLNMKTGRREPLPFLQKFSFNGPSVAWSPRETKFFVRGFERRQRLAITIEPDGTLMPSVLEGTNAPPVLRCFGRTGDTQWWSGHDWGVSYNRDTRDDLTAWTLPGLDSALRIEKNDGKKDHVRVLSVSVRPGWLHLAGFYFGDVGFVQGTNECLFESNGYLYLLDISARRLGTLVKGSRFIQLTPRYEKGF